jgi:hypothetical protein
VIKEEHAQKMAELSQQEELAKKEVKSRPVSMSIGPT